MRVREAVDRCLDDAAQGRGRPPKYDAAQVFQVAIEHRLMHAETLAYMFHQLPLERKFPGRPGRPPVTPPVVPRMAEIPAGTATLGLARREDAFGWDNEFEAHTVHVPAFSIGAGNVTNGQFLEFLFAGGYDHRSLWSDADWAWREQHNLRHPAFWVRRGDRWYCRTMFEELPLPLDWPVYVSHAEASAYARWKGLALPTEAQFHRAAYAAPDGSERMYPWGDAPPDAARGNFDFARWDPAPAGTFPAGNSAFGVADLVGNGWEWTSTVFAPFAGFEPLPFYRGYSADFFDGKHYVIKGGSPRTAARMLRRSFRNWFQGHYPYVYAAFRCVGN
jgi:ergothioneine biosynthesis protein EgtB